MDGVLFSLCLYLWTRRPFPGLRSPRDGRRRFPSTWEVARLEVH
jgi:hypothetical protein